MHFFFLLLLETIYFKSLELRNRITLLSPFNRFNHSQLRVRKISAEILPPPEHYQINESKTHDRRVIGQSPIKREKKSVNRLGGRGVSSRSERSPGKRIAERFKVVLHPLRGSAIRIRRNIHFARLTIRISRHKTHMLWMHAWIALRPVCTQPPPTEERRRRGVQTLKNGSVYPARIESGSESLKIYIDLCRRYRDESGRGKARRRREGRGGEGEDGLVSETSV